MATPRTYESAKPHRHLAEQRCDLVKAPILPMASPTARTAIRPEYRVVVGLPGNDLPLNTGHKLFRLDQS
jgi:hypothetical protein